MRCIKSCGRYVLFAVGLVLFCDNGPTLAVENQKSAVYDEADVNFDQEEPDVHYPTEGDFFVGYRWVSTEDSLQAAKYIYPHSSAVFGVNLVSCPLPFRYHLHSEFLNKYDFYADSGFAYSDLVLFRDILVGAHHNLNHFDYQLPDASTISYLDKNPGDAYSIDFTSNLSSLRLKMPDFPAHAFLKHRYVAREGLIQERFVLWQDLSNSIKTSQSRAIDWKSSALTLGTNSHLGPVEVEYDYNLARFNADGDTILYDAYPTLPDTIPTVDFTIPGDTYPHNVIAETQTSGHTLKMHSSYTGGIVSAGTISNQTNKNNYSGMESTTWKGAFDFSWIPEPVVALFFKYRHKNVEKDTPDTTTLTGLTTSVTLPVRQGISYDQDSFSLATRYKMLKNLSLFADYEFTHLTREDIDEWTVLPDESDTHTINLTADSRPLKNIQFKADYEYKNYKNPSYNNTPDYSHTLRVTSTYTPTAWMYLYLEYIYSKNRRDTLRYHNIDPETVIRTGERDTQKDQFLASLSFQFSPRLSMTTSWFFHRWNVNQALVYNKWLSVAQGDLPYIDANVPYTDKSNSYSLSFFYFPTDDITLAASANIHQGRRRDRI